MPAGNEVGARGHATAHSTGPLAESSRLTRKCRIQDPDQGMSTLSVRRTRSASGLPQRTTPRQQTTPHQQPSSVNPSAATRQQQQGALGSSHTGAPQGSPATASGTAQGKTPPYRTLEPTSAESPDRPMRWGMQAEYALRKPSPRCNTQATDRPPGSTQHTVLPPSSSAPPLARIYALCIPKPLAGPPVPDPHGAPPQ